MHTEVQLRLRRGEIDPRLRCDIAGFALQLCGGLIRTGDLIFPTGESKNSCRLETPKTGQAVKAMDKSICSLTSDLNI